MQCTNTIRSHAGSIFDSGITAWAVSIFDGSIMAWAGTIVDGGVKLSSWSWAAALNAHVVRFTRGGYATSQQLWTAFCRQ